MFGTEKYGKEAYDFFEDDNVLCFTDNNEALTGKYMYEKEIILPSDIQSHYKEYLIILAAREELCIEMEYQLMKMGIENSLNFIFVRDYILSGRMDFNEFIDRYARNIGRNVILEGGNLLGSIRNGGFVPWDDIDVVMLRNEYN